MKKQPVFSDFYRLLLVALILIYSVVFTRLAFDQHLGMRTHKADLGQIDQAVWNSSRGRFVEMTDNGFIATRMTDHVEPILALISPILWLWDDVRALLLLQVVLVAVGAWPLYELALLRLDQLLSTQERSQIWHFEPLRQMTRPLALILAIAYLLAPQLQSAVLTEFHAVPLAAPLILWAFWAVETRRWKQFMLATLLVALVKEETALLAAGLGVWALWRCWVGDREQGARGREQGAGSSVLFSYSPIPLFLLLITLLSLAWFYISTFVIVPAYAQQVYKGTQSIYFQRFGALGDSPVDIGKSFFTQPGVVWRIATEPARLQYLWGLLAPFGFFALLAPEIVLLSLPVLLANLLSAYPAQYYGEIHYSAPLIPYIAVSAAYGLGRLWGWLGRRTGQTSPSFQHLPAANAGVMALMAFWRNSRTALRPLLAIVLGLWLLSWAVLAYRQTGRGPLAARYDPTPISAHDRLLDRFVAQLPADAAVTATAAVHPHVSHRRFVYQFPIGLESPGQANWALLDVTTATDMAPGDVKTHVDQMLASDWGVVDAADGFLLLHKGVANKVIPDAFYDFARTTGGERNPLIATGPALQFLKLTVEDWPRWRQTKIEVDWGIGVAFNPASVSPQLEIVTPNGEVVANLADVAPPALIWYPPQRWRPGETVRMTTLPLYLPKQWGVLVSQSPGGMAAPLPRGDDGNVGLAAIYQRTYAEQLVSLSSRLADEDVLKDGVRQASALGISKIEGNFNLGQRQKIKVTGWLPAHVWPGKPMDLWLQWSGIERSGIEGASILAWPKDLTSFIHLRRQATNLAQNDGLPRYFISYPISAILAKQGFADDWRQLLVPADTKPGEILTVVIGLYNPQTGQRADLLDPNGNVIGNELVLGQVQVASLAVPDQACALIAQTCAAQPER